MGLFDQLVGDALGTDEAQSQHGASSLVEGLLGMLSSKGGVEGLSRQFGQQGLGSLVSSWIGTGQNQPISPDQILSTLGSGTVTELAQRAGLSGGQGASVLAALLPALIDKLTPNGQLPQPGQLTEIGRALLGTRTASAAGGGAAAPQPEVRAMAGDKPRPDFSDVQSGSSTAPQPAAPQTYTVAKGDSLSKIAKKMYGDANQWKRIFEANKDTVKDPDKIFPGQKLVIPKA